MPTNICTDNMINVNNVIQQGSCNLAYYSVRKPRVSENIIIANILEQDTHEHIILNPETTNVYSKMFLLTDKYVTVSNTKIEPLYYYYALEYPVYNMNDKTGLSIVGEYGSVPDKYKILQYNNMIDDNNNTITLYTNFSIQDTASVYVIYNTIINNKVVIGRKELIRPIPYMHERITPGILFNNEYRITYMPDAIQPFKIERPTNNTYYLKPIDSKRISAKEALPINNNWRIRICNGSTEKYIPDIADPKHATYSVPDYYTQTFSNLGFPYMRITDEVPTIINSNTINVFNTPMHIYPDYSNVTISINGASITPRSIDVNKGNITLPVMISNTDIILVSYHYIEDAYIYSGYTYTKKNGTSVFVSLDLNPSAYSDNIYLHTYSYIDDNDMLITKPSFTLLNKTVYIYSYPSRIRSVSNSDSNEYSALSIYREVLTTPSKKISEYEYDIELSFPVISNTFNPEFRTKYSDVVIPYYNNNTGNVCWKYVANNNRMIRFLGINFLCGEPIVARYLTNNRVSNEAHDVRKNTNTLFHTIRKLTNEEMDRDNIILVAELYVRPNAYREGVKLIDTRVRGGGLIDMTDSLAFNINPETQYYLDIGDIFGKPVQTDGVIIIDVDINLCAESGGPFTKTDIENAINKHKGIGILPVIRYIEPTAHSKIV